MAPSKARGKAESVLPKPSLSSCFFPATRALNMGMRTNGAMTGRFSGIPEKGKRVT